MAPSKASERAKAKLQAVLDNPNRNDASGRRLPSIPDKQGLTCASTGYKQRVMATKNPMGSGDVNMVTRRDSNTRRMSTTSEGSAGEVQRRWSMVKNWINRPAY
ncbi:hypothetical protein MRS44_015611 [Fusarium solani]|uniref:uncharacterized protein n=1 Tax=Fusarium solani TaxID=169388 RepID=UPI0032C441D5|nr:hypothetical protein MRS44_015611 [Fusarium solani]